MELGPIVWLDSADTTSGGSAATTITVEIDRTTRRQRIFGFGCAFTEAAGWTFAQLPAAGREKVLRMYWDGVSDGGMGYSTGRIAMNSPDFALSHYAYANVSGDVALAHFQHALPRDNEYVLPLLRAAMQRHAQSRAQARARGAGASAPLPPLPPLRLFSAPWSPPAWMKLPPPKPAPSPGSPPAPAPAPAMNYSRADGLRPDVSGTWARYFSLWHTAMSAQLRASGGRGGDGHGSGGGGGSSSSSSSDGGALWGFSAQNEPLAHGRMWDCLGYSLANYTRFVDNYLRPVMERDHPGLQFLAFDHNPDHLQAWAEATYNESAALRDWAWGAAVHWYSEEAQRGTALNATHAAAPGKPILHTEGCSCGGVAWPNSSRWWGVGETYGVGLMQYLQNWAVGFTDWNLILDAAGGPSHDRHPPGCNAPLQAAADAADGSGVAVQAPYYFLAHFARHLPPESTVVGAMAYAGAHAPARRGMFYYAPGAEGADGRLAALGAVQPNGTAVLVLLNTGDKPVVYRVRDSAAHSAPLRIGAHAIQTLRWNWHAY